MILEAVLTLRKDFVYDKNRNFSGWLHGVWHHSYCDYLKNRDRRPDVAVGGPIADDPLRDAQEFVNFLDDLIQREMSRKRLHRLRLRCPGDAPIFLAKWQNEWTAAETATQLRKHPRRSIGLLPARLQLETICRELGVAIQPREREADE